MTKELIHFKNFDHGAYSGCRFAHRCDHLLFLEVVISRGHV